MILWGMGAICRKTSSGRSCRACERFSTFAARRLVNIHDLHVRPEHQGRGIARRLLDAVEAEARAMECCKLTLEVQENNHGARALYERVGFSGGQYEPAAGTVLFRQKTL